MTPHQAYRRSAQSGWTRIEMLLAIYDATISSLDAGIDAINQNNFSASPGLQLRASQLLLLLISGVDADSSPVAARIRELCIFCIDQIGTSEASSWISAREVLTTLRDGFQGIREEGMQLEAAGTISQLPSGTSQTLLHV